MTLDEAIDLAYSLAEEDSSSPRHAATVSRALGNIVYDEICRECRTSRTNGTITTADGTREYAVAAAAVVIERVEYLASGETIGIPLDTCRFSDVGNSEGPSDEYYQTISDAGAIKIGFKKMPDAVYSYPYWYFQGATTDLGADDSLVLVPSRWHFVESYGIVAEWAKMDKGADSAEFQKWNALYAGRKRDLFRYLHGGGASADAYPGVR